MMRVRDFLIAPAILMLGLWSGAFMAEIIPNDSWYEAPVILTIGLLTVSAYLLYMFKGGVK